LIAAGDWRFAEFRGLRIIGEWGKAVAFGQGDLGSPVEVRKAEIDQIWPAPSASDRQQYRTGAPGHPSSMFLVEAEFERRAAADTLFPSMKAEAEHLAAWLNETHPSAPPTTPKTIQNRLGGKHRDAVGRSQK